MSDKVKLPKEIDKAINTLRMGDFSDYGIVAMTTWTSQYIMEADVSGDSKKAIETLRRWTFSDMEDEDDEWKISTAGPARADKLLQALVNGYEVEETPEDKVRQFYWDLSSYNVQMTAHKAVKEAFDILGIKIKGVNAE